MDEALTYHNGHICKGHPTEVIEFYLHSTEAAEFFRGIIDVKVAIVKAAVDDPNNNAAYPSYHSIVFDITGHLISCCHGKSAGGDAEVNNNSSTVTLCAESVIQVALKNVI